MKKLPPLNAQYWALILSATTLGETAGDLTSMSLGLGYALSSVVLVGLFVVALALQLSGKIKSSVLYWTVIVLASTSGTTMCDFITRSLKLGYGWGSLLLVSTLAVIFGLWRATTPTTAVDAPLSTRTQSFYWAAMLLSSTLGTALGDFLSDDTPLGFGGATLVLAGLLVAITLLALSKKVSKDVCYWAAIVITHPIGATMGDYLTKPEGFNLGTVISSLLLLGVFGIVVAAGKLANKTSLQST